MIGKIGKQERKQGQYLCHALIPNHLIHPWVSEEAELRFRVWIEMRGLTFKARQGTGKGLIDCDGVQRDGEGMVRSTPFKWKRWLYSVREGGYCEAQLYNLNAMVGQ